VQFFRLRFRAFNWVALLAVFALAFAPTVSHALAASGQGGFNPWAEVCSTAGNAVSAAAAQAAGTEAPAPAGLQHLEHCPLCGIGAQVPVLPLSPPAAFIGADGAHFLPLLFAHAPRPLFAWAAAQPRGPPSAS